MLSDFWYFEYLQGVDAIYVEYDVQYHKMISDVIFGRKYVTICNFSAQLGLILDFSFIWMTFFVILCPSQSRNSSFLNHNRVPWVKISNRANFELNIIISCYLSIITTDFLLILRQLTSYSTLQWRLRPSESQNSIFPTSPSCSLSENM